VTALRIGGLRENQSRQQDECGGCGGEQGEFGHLGGLLQDGEHGIPAPF
tara:strand:+ start:59136 stop:59282 length:147 start_codon:yes stop_codon:yes gene_type:complete